ncbi:prepilin peptidase [Thioclava sp. GXIMD4216]|uniref:A24 family peptidase n=1 Tax=Thioclava sp. GXIMD4216 TaxID=3131929 RepID=UPI0030CB61B1
MFAAPPFAAACLFLLAMTPVCLWVAATDLRDMKIRNVAVYTTAGIFVFLGLAVLPPEVWAWRWVNFAVVLAIGFALFAFAGFGAGDVKFVSVAALFVSHEPGQISLAMICLSVGLLAGLGLHQLLKRLPALTRATSGWRSWTAKRTPAGVGLALALWIYLALAVLAAA